MSLSRLREELRTPGRPVVLSSDLFDTVLLRDHTTEVARLAAGCARAGRELGVDPTALTRLRLSFHTCAYQAVAVRNPDGDAGLMRIDRTVVRSLGLDDRAATVLAEAEIAVDIEHLRPNRPLLDILGAAVESGIRVIAVSDTYYSGEQLQMMIRSVVGYQPFDEVYSSSDLQMTKQSGQAFAEVARRESLRDGRVVHVGDSHRADVQRAIEAGWTAVHLPRRWSHRMAKLAGKAIAWSRGMRRRFE